MGGRAILFCSALPPCARPRQPLTPAPLPQGARGERLRTVRGNAFLHPSAPSRLPSSEFFGPRPKKSPFFQRPKKAKNAILAGGAPLTPGPSPTVMPRRGGEGRMKLKTSPGGARQGRKKSESAAAEDAVDQPDAQKTRQHEDRNAEPERGVAGAQHQRRGDDQRGHHHVR